jgi:hypothetical protein
LDVGEGSAKAVNSKLNRRETRVVRRGSVGTFG